MKREAELGDEGEVPGRMHLPGKGLMLSQLLHLQFAHWAVVGNTWGMGCGVEQVVSLRTAGLRKTFFSKKREKERLPLGVVQAIGPVLLLLSGNHRITSCMFLIDSFSHPGLFLSSFPE